MWNYEIFIKTDVWALNRQVAGRRDNTCTKVTVSKRTLLASSVAAIRAKRPLRLHSQQLT